jgi:hypothetical protein
MLERGKGSGWEAAKTADLRHRAKLYPRTVTNILLAIIAGVLLVGRDAMVGSLWWIGGLLLVIGL